MNFETSLLSYFGSEITGRSGTSLRLGIDAPYLAIRSYLNNVFWPNIFVGASFKILEILKYSSGSKRGPAAILNQNPIFEMASGYWLLVIWFLKAERKPLLNLPDNLGYDTSINK
jgi:hypothetical protein